MRERGFVVVWRLEVVLASLGVAVFLAPSAGAALKKYGVARQSLLHYNNSSPLVQFDSTDSTGSLALVDDSGASPVLAKLVLTLASASTVDIPGLTNGFIFIPIETTEGPGADQTGTGSTSSSIVWGNLDGWTISGTVWCHAMPSFVCDLASGQESETTDPVFLSSNYDLGTWTFHGTGWTANLGYINRTGVTATGTGNLQYILRGVRVYDATVPALPLLGIAAVSVGFFAMSLVAVRRRSG